MNYEKTLHLIYENEYTMDSLKSFFIEVAETTKPSNLECDDAVLGQQYRGYLFGKEIINKAFEKLRSMNTVQSKAVGINYK